MQIFECVPNYSIDSAEDFEALRRVFGAFPEVDLLGAEFDVDHGRAVITLLGPPEELTEAVLASVEMVIALTDLHEHKGVHPFIGALDVLPFIPFSKDATMQAAAELAVSAAEKIAARFGVPSYLYEEAAREGDRKNLASVRKKVSPLRTEAFARRNANKSLSAFKPDVGEAKFHPTAGAICAGARFFLVAFNVNLDSKDLALAKSIASKIRESAGGLPGVKSLGLMLESKGLAQVSMNIVDYRKTGIDEALSAVEQLASDAGVRVHSTEIIGLVPKNALTGALKRMLLLPEEQTVRAIEDVKLLHDLRRIDAIIGTGANSSEVAARNENQLLRELPLETFTDRLSSADPSPGGGAVAALIGALSAALGTMVARITAGKKNVAEDVRAELTESITRLSNIENELTGLMDDDAKAYREFSVSLRGGGERQLKLLRCFEVPESMAKELIKAKTELTKLRKSGTKYAQSDVEIGILLASAAFGSALITARSNLPFVVDETLRGDLETRLRNLEAQMDDNKSQNAEQTTKSASELPDFGSFPVFDFDQAMRRVGNSKEILLEISEQFLADASDYLKNVNDAIESGDLLGLEKSAHALKGAAASLSFERIRRAAEFIEKHAKSGLTDDVRLAASKLGPFIAEATEAHGKH
ncbi:MAG: glutamate formimidoyltransferase [Planctomycetes bacterium]|nr:glutamate formimidoyltransferase [Planctomycetota bacterium]